MFHHSSSIPENFVQVNLSDLSSDPKPLEMSETTTDLLGQRPLQDLLSAQ